jgi:threonine efflux protein
MSIESLILIMTIHAVALISPGPDFAIVTRLSIVSGRRSGLWGAAGVVTAIGIYVLISVLGLSLVLAALPGLSRVLSVAGALYLGWLGVQCLRSKGQLPQAQSLQPVGKAFITGFLTNLLNPKAMLYFGSILSQALTPDLSTTDVVILWFLLVGESLLWFGFVAFMFSSQRVLEWLRNRMLWFDRIVGAVLLGLAVKVATSVSR